jgi:hypothetical protein
MRRRAAMSKPPPDDKGTREKLPNAPSQASSPVPTPPRAVEAPKQVTAVLVALTLGHLRVAEEQMLVHPTSGDGERGSTRTAFLALADARRELERAREAQHCLTQVRSGKE